MKFGVFVISLDRSLDRRISCTKNLTEIGISPIIFSATDGNNLTEEDLSCVQNNQINEIHLALNRKVTIDHKLEPREIGCSLSHLKLYKKIIQENYDFALILEDDAILTKNINELISFLQKNTFNWDVIQLSNDSGIRSAFYSKKESFNNEVFLKQEGFGSHILDSIFNRRRFCWLTSSYFITAKACQRLIDIGYPVRFTADVLLGHVASNRLKMFRAHPNIFVESVDSFESTIRDRNVMKIY